MAQQNKTRLYILIALTIVSAIIFILAVIPNSPFVASNACMDNEKAKQMYESKNIAVKNKYIEERNEQCKELIKYAEEPKTTYDKLDACNMIDSVIDASKHYIELHQGDKELIHKEVVYLADNIKKYTFCPQYEDVAKYLNTTEKSVR